MHFLIANVQGVLFRNGPGKYDFQTPRGEISLDHWVCIAINLFDMAV